MGTTADDKRFDKIEKDLEYLKDLIFIIQERLKKVDAKKSKRYT